MLKLKENGNLEKILLFIGILYLYLLGRRGGDSKNICVLILMGITFIQSYKTDLIKYKAYKKEIIAGLIYVFLLSLNFYFTENKIGRWGIFTSMTLYTVLFLCACLNLDLKEKYYKYLVPLLVATSLGSIFRGLKDTYLHRDILSWYRIAGGTYTTIYAAEVGLYAVIGILCFVYYKKIYQRIFFMIYTVINIFLVLMTQSRNSTIGIPLTLMIVCIILYKKKSIAFILGILFLALVSVKTFPNLRVVQRLQTVTSIEKIKSNARYKIFSIGIKTGKKNLLKGEGFYKHKDNGISERKPYENNPHYHNVLIETFATQGILCLISYVSFLGILFVRLLKNYFVEESNERKAIKLIGISSFIFMMCYGQFEPIFYFSKINQLAFTIILLSLIVDKTYLNKKEK